MLTTKQIINLFMKGIGRDWLHRLQMRVEPVYHSQLLAQQMFCKKNRGLANIARNDQSTSPFLTKSLKYILCMRKKPINIEKGCAHFMGIFPPI